MRFTSLLLALLSNLLTPAFSPAATADLGAKDSGIDVGFYENLRNLRPLSQSVKEATSPNFQMAAIGGWHGSGGGGGVTCFPTLEAKRKAVDDKGHLKAEEFSRITNFQVFDLYDLDFKPDLPQTEGTSAYVFLQTRIRERLGRALPYFATYLAENYAAAWTAKWIPEPQLEVFPDEGPLVSGKIRDERCVYVQWAFRVQNILSPLPHYEIRFHQTLDQHLQKILSPQEYQNQKTILILHESVYAALSLLSAHESSYTRSLLDYLLTDEEFFQKKLTGDKIETAFWSMWIRELMPLVHQSTQLYGAFKQQTWNAHQKEQWSNYQSFLRRINMVLQHYAMSAQIKPINTITFANHNTDLHQAFIYNLLYPAAAMPDQNTFLNAMQSFFLLSLNLEAAREIDGLQRFVFEDRTNHPVWKQACAGVERIQKKWAAEKTPQDLSENNMIGVRRWHADRAVRFCKDAGLLSSGAASP